MTHLGQIKRFGRVPTEWLTVNSQIHKLVTKWSGRDDLTTCVSEEAGRGQAPALFDPMGLRVEVNSKIAFGERKPATIGDMQERKVQFEFQKASGAIFHEASHAKFTTWNLVAAAKALSDKENDALHLLEESRIEGLGARFNPENKPFLRACALEIVIGDMKAGEEEELSGVRRMARLAALLLARRDAGVLKEHDVKRFRQPIYDVLGEDVVQKELRPIWQEFQTITRPEYDLQRMYRLAKEWSKIVDRLAKDEDAMDDAMREAMQQMMEGMMGDLADQAGDTEIQASNDAFDQEMQERQDAKRAEKEAKAAEKSQNKKAADEVFKKDPPKHQNSGGRLRYTDSGSRLAQKRTPTAAERQAAIQIGKDLEKAKYHDRIRIESDSEVPPGRIRMRTVMQGKAYKAMNIRTTVKPFERVQRKHEIDPDIVVGVMTDISGSMSAAMEPMGVTGWIMNEALHRIQGKIAMVNYGYDVTPTLKPGQHMSDVHIYTAPDGSEAFSLGFKALDGALTLLDGRGARLLVIVSDGNYKDDEEDLCRRWLKRCVDEGVAVLWIGYGSAYGAKSLIGNLPVEFVKPAATPVETAKLVGQAAIRALAAAGASDK